MRFSAGIMILGSMLFAVTGCNTNATPPPILIGHVSDKTRLDRAGDQAELGIRLALSEVQKDGTPPEELGGRKIEVRHTDTRGELAAYESQAVRLDAVNRCVALMGGLSAQEVTALDHVKMPMLTFHGQQVSGASNQVFYLGMTPSRQGEVLGKVVVEDRSVKRIVIVQDERRSDLTDLAETFQKAAFNARADLVAQFAKITILRFAQDAKWSDLVQRLSDQKPDAIVFAGSVQDFNAWYRVFRKEFGKGAPQLVYAGNDGDSTLFDLDNAEVSVLLATAFYADPDSEKMGTFMKAYRAAFETTADVHSALAYDGFRMLVEALKRTPTQLTSERIREELLKTKDFEGLTGPLTITADRQVQRTLYVVRWQNGVLKAVKTFAP